MAKTFEKRMSKKIRPLVNQELYQNFALFNKTDQKLLEGMKLDELKLDNITVKEQVRTKFNDASLKELADNIKSNGLIQPLVVHRENNSYVLICGERRYRAMRLINQKMAPCYILTNKSPEELMAIQFSENSAREALHYIDKAEGILLYQQTTKASERKIQEALGISKAEVHRGLLIAQMDDEIKKAAKTWNIEKYVLLEWHTINTKKIKEDLRQKIIKGEIKKRVQLRPYIEDKAIFTNDSASLKELGIDKKMLEKLLHQTSSKSDSKKIKKILDQLPS